MDEQTGQKSGRICPMCGADEWQHLSYCQALSFGNYIHDSLTVDNMSQQYAATR